MFAFVYLTCSAYANACNPRYERKRFTFHSQSLVVCLGFRGFVHARGKYKDVNQNDNYNVKGDIHDENRIPQTNARSDSRLDAYIAAATKIVDCVRQTTHTARAHIADLGHANCAKIHNKKEMEVE